MSKHKKSLLVVSDTPMYLTENGYSVLESTLREIEFLADHFSCITWIGFPYKKNNGLGRIPNTANLVLKQFPPAMGGKSPWHKVKILPYLPILFLKIMKEMSKHEVIHTRGPSVPALITLVVSMLWKKKYWHKYAGNWRQAVIPKAYAVQRYLLMRSNNFVAVNGRLPNDPKQICTIENPCFSENELQRAKVFADQKQFTGKLILLFVGRVEQEKGIFDLLQAFVSLKDRFLLQVVGPGKDYARALDYSGTIISEVRFYGALQRDALNELYAQAHVLILPSRSEGFPKVVAEGAGFGCIPICTDISSIGEYIVHGKNGFLLKETSHEAIHELLDTLPGPYELKQVSQRATEMAELFTYERYVQNIKQKLSID